MSIVLAGLALASTVFTRTAAAQTAGGHQVNVALTGVPSDAGEVLVGLCGDRSDAFPGGCNAYRVKTKATLEATMVTFNRVAPGAYALQAWHDENSDGRMDFPQEGDTATRASLMYRNAAMGAAAMPERTAAGPAGDATPKGERK